MSYKLVAGLQSSDENEAPTTVGETPSEGLTNWHGGPRTLGRGPLESLGAWTWDILLTLAPICFFGPSYSLFPPRMFL